MAEGPAAASILANRLIRPGDYWDYENEFTAQAVAQQVLAASAAEVHITNIYINVKGIVDVTLSDSTGAVKWKYYGTASGTGVFARLRSPIIIAPAKKLLVDSSGAVTFFIAVTGYYKAQGA